jgi:ribulose-5-phosphate 4-epimerase/fuculose-1-phosphate aldolase
MCRNVGYFQPSCRIRKRSVKEEDHKSAWLLVHNGILIFGQMLHKLFSVFFKFEKFTQISIIARMNAKELNLFPRKPKLYSLGPVVQSTISANPGLNFNLLL